MNYVTRNDLIFMFFVFLFTYKFLTYCKGGGLKTWPRTIGKGIGLVLKPFKGGRGK